jgi:hypothetical protein
VRVHSHCRGAVRVCTNAIYAQREERHTQSVIKTSVLECFDQSAEMIITNGIKYNRFSKNLVDLGV